MTPAHFPDLVAEAHQLNVRLHFNQRGDFSWNVGAYTWDGRRHVWAADVRLETALRRCLDAARRDFHQPADDARDLV